MINNYKKHIEFTSQAFPKGTAMGALIHAKQELEEIEAAINYHEGIDRVTEEFADVFACLIDSCHRFGITPEMLNEAFDKKLKINQSRVWKYDGDGCYYSVK